jgi:CheY-like chemotaxis protein
MNAKNTHGRTGKAHRALLIDDDKFMLVVLSDMLRDLGTTQITTAANGISGIEAIDRAPQAPDVVVCDLSMPGGDGFEFMERLSVRGFSGGIVLVSGMDSRTLNSASLMAKFHRLNILATLSKPVDEAALGAALAKLN